MVVQKSLTRQFLLCLLPVFAICGCSNNGEVTFKSGGTTQTFAEGKTSVPKEFEALVYPQSTTTGSVSADGDNQEQSKFLMLSSTSTPEVVSNWYQTELAKQNWKVDKVQGMPKLISITGHKDDTDVNVMIAEDGGKTTISLQAGKQGDTVNDDKEPAENYAPDKVNPPTD
jgi:hypothetical protein